MEYKPKTFGALDSKPRPVIEDISVVIPTLGRDILQECLYWIAAGSAWPEGVIIVDQGNRPEAENWVSTLRSMGITARYISSTQRGRSAGINRGFEQVRTPFVAVTDDDCFVDTEWIQRMGERLRQKPEVIVTGRVDLAGDDEVEFSVVSSRIPRVYNRPQLRVHPLIGGNMGISMSNVGRIGFFDEHPSLNAAEDGDWGYRALRLGITIIYDPEIIVRHFHWRDASQRAARYREYCRSQGAFYGKHLLSGDLLIPMQAGRDLIRGPLRWLRGSLKGDQDMIDRGRADTLELFPGILSGLRRRRQT